MRTPALVHYNSPIDFRTFWYLTDCGEIRRHNQNVILSATCIMGQSGRACGQVGSKGQQSVLQAEERRSNDIAANLTWPFELVGRLYCWPLPSYGSVYIMCFALVQGVQRRARTPASGATPDKQSSSADSKTEPVLTLQSSAGSPLYEQPAPQVRACALSIGACKVRLSWSKSRMQSSEFSIPDHKQGQLISLPVLKS